MIQQPVVAIVIRNNLGVVTGAFPPAGATWVALYDGGVVIACHSTAVLVGIGSHQFGGTAHNGLVGAVPTLTATAHRAEQVIILTAFVYHGTLEGSTRQLSYPSMTSPTAIRLRIIEGLEVFHAQRIICQLCNTDIIKASPYQILLVELLHIAGVDTVLHANLCAAEHLAVVRELSGRIAYCHTDTCTGTVAPQGRSIEAYILTIHIAYVGSP